MTVFFKKKGFFNFFSKTYFVFRNIFFQIKAFSNKKTSFSNEKVLFWFKNAKIASKLFIRYLPRRIAKIESARKGEAIEKCRAVIGGKRINGSNNICSHFQFNSHYKNNSYNLKQHKLCKHVVENVFCYWKKKKNTIKNQIFCKTFSTLLPSIYFFFNFFIIIK